MKWNRERTIDEQSYDIWKSIEQSIGAKEGILERTTHEERKAHYKKLGDRNVELGVLPERAVKGGKTVTPKKLKVIKETNKMKRELTDEQVLEMKELYKNDISIDLPFLAEKYGVCTGTIKYALEGKNYSDVGEPVKIRPALFKCEHCDIMANKTNTERWHGDNCKLKGINKQDIIDEYNVGGTSFAKLGKKWGLSPSMIDKIVNNK